MRPLLEIVRLELRRLWRSRAALALLGLSLVWMFAMPHVLKSDGTPGGARELYVHFSLGGAFALTLIALASSAASSLSRERDEKRLQLTLVRPVRFFAVALARMIALVAVGAANLAICAAVLAFSTDTAIRCSRVVSPVMISPRAEAELMYDEFMKDPETPPEVKKTKKSVVLRLLTQKAVDNYQSIAPGEMPKKRRGRPSFLKSRKSPCQSGCGTMATRNPSASNIRPITAAPKDGWSI